MNDQVRIFSDASALGEAAARELTALLAELTAEAGRSASDNPVDIAIAGGFVASSVLSRVDSDDNAERPAWERVRVWWADERYVAADSPDRNDAEAIEGLFARTPGVDLHPMPTNEGQSIQEAAQACLEEWQSHMEGRQIDVAVLGMGPDGHFASLFPGHSTLDGTDDVLLEEDSPKPPPARLTLSREVLTSARHIWVIAGGASKAEALGRAFAGADFHDIPIAALRGERTTWWLDEEAAAQLG